MSPKFKIGDRVLHGGAEDVVTAIHIYKDSVLYSLASTSHVEKVAENEIHLTEVEKLRSEVERLNGEVRRLSNLRQSYGGLG